MRNPPGGRQPANSNLGAVRRRDGQPCGDANALQPSCAGVGKPAAATKDGSHFAVSRAQRFTIVE
jgi:hypothetical protein